jgi:type III secretion protein D
LPAAAAPSIDDEQKTRPPLRRRAEAWLAATGAAVLLACGGSLWMAHVAAAPVPPVAFSTPLLAEALKGGEFASLAVSTQPDGRPLLRGRLADLAQRTRLEAWLAARQWTPALDLVVDEVVARDIAEVFRVNGIPAQAKAAGAGRFVAEVAERDAQRLARAEDVVRRDVRGVQQLSLRNTAVPLAPPPAPPVPDDPNKRIASLVPGEPAYVVTADGAHYFVGALLPSGHRIAQIAAQRVVLERDGQQTSLNF